MPGDDVILEIKESIGYLSGQVDSLIKTNGDDHKEIKESIKEACASAEKIEISQAALEKVIASHENTLKTHENRIHNVERRQEYVAAVGKFIMDHPKLVLFGFSIVILGLLGWGADQIIVLLKNL